MRTKAPDTFYIRAPRLNQLNILQQLASDAYLTQAELARRCGLSVAMVNNYMKELCALGLLEYHRKSSRSVSYHITSSGESFIDEIRQDLIEEMVGLFAEAKSRLRILVTTYAVEGVRRIILFGTGHFAELAFHALESTGVNVIGVCADDPLLIGREWCGRQVLSPSQIRFADPDAVVVADLRRTDEICRSLTQIVEPGIRIIRLDGVPGSGPEYVPSLGSQPATIPGER
jgi:predicted transcriptional regulator